MSLAVIFGPNSGRHDMADMRAFVEHEPRVAALFERAAAWSGIPVDALLHRRPRPDTVSPTRLNAIALTAGMLGIYEALGARPAVVGGISLGERVAACAAGALSPRDLVELLAVDDARPADPERAEGIAFVFVPAGDDTERYRRAPGVRVAVDYGLVRRGHGHLMMLSGRRADLVRLADRSALSVDVSEPPYSSAAHHTPLRAHASAAIERRLAGMTLRDPAVPVCSGLGSGRSVTTAGGVRELLVRGEVEPLSVPGMIGRVAAHGATHAIAIGPFLRRSSLPLPFPVSYVETPGELGAEKTI